MVEKTKISLNNLILIFTEFNKDNNLKKYINIYNISEDIEILVPLAKLQENHEKINTLYDNFERNIVDKIRNNICEIQIRIIINNIIKNNNNNICDSYIKAIRESITSIIHNKEYYKDKI